MERHESIFVNYGDDIDVHELETVVSKTSLRQVQPKTMEWLIHWQSEYLLINSNYSRWLFISWTFFMYMTGDRKNQKWMHTQNSKDYLICKMHSSSRNIIMVYACTCIVTLHRTRVHKSLCH